MKFKLEVSYRLDYQPLFRELSPRWCREGARTREGGGNRVLSFLWLTIFAPLFPLLGGPPCTSLTARFRLQVAQVGLPCWRNSLPGWVFLISNWKKKNNTSIGIQEVQNKAWPLFCEQHQVYALNEYERKNSFLSNKKHQFDHYKLLSDSGFCIFMQFLLR